ncbi:MAG TPA: formylglycine-generating enzyme family protein [Gammaproteobacteria bacterium]|nr:formylglycine-generating enzyme family protein [Gammaproteobacteria bacterium]
MKSLNHALFMMLLAGTSLLAQADNAATDKNLKLRFVTIPAGEFVMGTVDLDEAIADLPDPKAAMIDDETPAHTVVFEKPFLLSQTEVTQQDWFNIMGTRPGPEALWKAENWAQLPVVSVSWSATREFIDTLNRRSPGQHYRLPTEAEWEYAARAGSKGLRPFSRIDMNDYAWYINSSNDEVQAVAQLKPNAWGLYDMYGNVWEWVSDWYSPAAYTQSEKISPQGPGQGDKKVRRGGSYHCPPHLIRPGYRAADLPSKAYSVLGFRLVAE